MRLAQLCVLVWLAASLSWAQTWTLEPSGTSASLRGISVVNRDVAWASGTGGTWVRTVDGGATWTAGVVPGAEALDFRGIQASSAQAAIVMSSGKGKQSTIWKTEDGGAHWILWYTNEDADGFFDAIVLPRSKLSRITSGLVLGDPVDGSFALFSLDSAAHPDSNHASRVLSRIPLPPALAAEGAFAASNTSLVMHDRKIWFGTGGPSAARVFRSTDEGQHWNIATTPLASDGPGAGIFSLAFRDGLHGVAVGGDYTKPAAAAHNVAVTNDGGRTWTEPAGTHPRGYRSAVAWLPDRGIWVTTGPSGSELSRDAGQNWTPFDPGDVNDGAFNAIAALSSEACWAVGPKGRIAKLEFASPSKR